MKSNIDNLAPEIQGLIRTRLSENSTLMNRFFAILCILRCFYGIMLFLFLTVNSKRAQFYRLHELVLICIFQIPLVVVFILMFFGQTKKQYFKY